MNINNPTTFSAPALVFSTSNSSGTAGALRANDTLAIFSTTVPTNVTAATVSAATGDNAFGSREDHVHGTTAIPAATSGQVLRTAGNLSTTSTTLVDVLGATVTITTGVFPVAYGAFQSLFSSATNNNIALNVDIDGSLELGATGTEWLLTTANFGFNGSFSGQSAELSAAEHTIKMQWKGQGATITLYANSDVAQLFWAHEIR